MLLLMTGFIFVCIQFIEFVLSEPEAYEIKMGERFIRRPGDPPYEDLLKELDKDKKKSIASSIDTSTKTEL